ncbi:hypothetical protein BV898_01149 [Hypsibius exemplaris]|uniref:Ig-like domain-containing protein n=1 Tax=Hypsibius exemplaris TaxID=2072580 RepID=A0A1W0XBQ8_HYPEX|nr:hypothetical protein BV898_01149 [Hypsibius exemplaris]
MWDFVLITMAVVGCQARPSSEPQVALHVTLLSGLEGDGLDLPCYHATQPTTQPDAVIHWDRIGGAALPTGSSTTADGSLRIPRLVPVNGGLYECRLGDHQTNSSHPGHVQRVIQVIVIPAPTSPPAN